MGVGAMLFLLAVLVVGAVVWSRLAAQRRQVEQERLQRYVSSTLSTPSSRPTVQANGALAATPAAGGQQRAATGAFGTLPLPPAQRQLTTRDHDDGTFDIEPPDGLPSFAAVGGMDDFKREIQDTVGLLVRNPDAAEAYGLQWNGVLLHGQPGVGKTFLARAIAGQFGMSLLHLSTGDLVEGVAGESARNVQRAFEAAAQRRPCLLLFDEFDSIAQRRDGGTHAEERRTVNQLLTCLEQFREHRDLVVVATTNDIGHLDPAAIRPGRFDRHIRIDLPDRTARKAIFDQQLRSRPSCTGVDLDDLAARTEGLTPAAITQVVDAAALAAFREASISGELVRIGQAHLLGALTERGGQDRPTVEDWDWDSLVLADDVKAELQQLQALVEDPDLAADLGVSPPSGVLLAGPPGTGKTTVARVLAAQARCSFYPVSAADVLSKWVGDSEQRIAQLFERARTNRPSIVFIDEIDAIGARRDAVSNESTSRLLNQLLQEMDGISGARGVLVVGATNRAELLDPALVRGGRLSRTITLPLPERDGRLAMLQLMTARMPTVDVDLRALADATGGLSGADLKAITQQAALHALVRARQSSVDDAEPAVLHRDFERALADRRESEAVHTGGP